MTSTMRAYVTGGTSPLTPADRPVPTVGREEVLVRTRSASLNNADLAGSDDEHIAGFEFAGDVVEVGAGAPAQLVGARVMGVTVGALAEFVVTHHSQVLPVAERLSHEEAAALPIGLGTEHGGLLLGGVAPRHRC